MRLISVCYSADKALLSEINAAIAGHAAAIEEPTEVESPATLNLDPATILDGLWKSLVAFGSIKATLEAVQIIYALLRERASKGMTSKAEFAVGRVKIALEGKMTPEQFAKEVRAYKSALTASAKVTPS
jgi:hypothetical protein